MWRKQCAQAGTLVRCADDFVVLCGTAKACEEAEDVRHWIADLNPVLRAWGNYFRTGNAAKKFNQVDAYVWRRLRDFMVRRQGRNLRPGETQQSTRDFFHRLGLHCQRGTVQYPEAA